MTNPLDTGHEEDVRDVFCTFDLRSVSRAKLKLLFLRCNMSDDFGPATSIMNMCFTYYYTSSVVHGEFYFRICKLKYTYVRWLRTDI